MRNRLGIIAVALILVVGLVGVIVGMSLKPTIVVTQNFTAQRVRDLALIDYQWNSKNGLVYLHFQSYGDSTYYPKKYGIPLSRLCGDNIALHTAILDNSCLPVSPDNCLNGGSCIVEFYTEPSPDPFKGIGTQFELDIISSPTDVYAFQIKYGCTNLGCSTPTSSPPISSAWLIKQGDNGEILDSYSWNFSSGAINVTFTSDATEMIGMLLTGECPGGRICLGSSGNRISLGGYELEDGAVRGDGYSCYASGQSCYYVSFTAPAQGNWTYGQSYKLDISGSLGAISGGYAFQLVAGCTELGCP